MWGLLFSACFTKFHESTKLSLINLILSHFDHSCIELAEQKYPPNLASSELSTCGPLILWKISEKANGLILSKAVKSPITVSSYVGSPLHFFKKSWLASPSPPFAFPSIFENFVFPSFYWSPSKMQKRSFPPSESFKLLLLACQCGHTIERRNTH